MKKGKEVKLLNTTSFQKGGTQSVLTPLSDINEGNIDYMNFINILQKTFQTLFKWNGLKLKESRLIEELLFRGGKVAIIKLTDTEMFITDFIKLKNSDGTFIEDIYGYPKQIQIISPKSKLNNKIIKDPEKFKIIYNNTTQTPTLRYFRDRIYGMVKSLKSYDIASVMSNIKILLDASVDEEVRNELINQWYSDNPFIKMDSATLRNVKNGEIDLSDNSNSKMENFLFSLNLLLTLLGFKSADLINKAERQTEMETANNDKFSGLLWKNMYDARKEAEEELKEIGINISVEEPELIKEQEENDKENKTGLNGEENKNEAE